MMRNGQQSVSTRSSGVHRPRELRKRSGSGGGKKKHARGEGGVPASRHCSAMTSSTRKKKRTNKRSSDDMDKHAERDEQEDKVRRLLTSPQVEDSDDDDVSSTSSTPPPTKNNKKTKEQEEEQEGQSEDESQTEEAGIAATSFRRQRNQSPPMAPTPPARQEILGGQPTNPPYQMDATAVLQAELRRLREENDKMKTQLSTPQQDIVQAARVTPAKFLIRGGGGEATLHHMKSNLELALKNFATKFVFPKAKFIQTDLIARQYCMLAVANNDVTLPTSATAEQFAEMYHNTLEKRVRQIRLNSNTGARVKFIADLKQGKVPEGFSYKTLKDGYRDYIIEDDDSEETQEKKKAGLVAFQYFVDRILASVNADRTKFGPEKHKRRVELLLSDAFTVSDEAYALFILENYETRWRLQYEHPNDKNKWRQDEVFQAKFTSSNNGLNHKESISNAIRSFNEKCAFVAEKRSNDTTGSTLEEKLHEIYNQGSSDDGMQADKPGGTTSRQQGDNGDKSEEYVQAYMDYDLMEALKNSSAAV